MTRKVFFSFDFDRDAWRAGQVRNSGVTRDNAGFLDAVDWEAVKKKGSDEIKKWIDNQLIGTSVTVVLIGAKTNESYFVKYELEQSWKKGNGILGIYIHQIKNADSMTDIKGSNSFGGIFTSSYDDKKYFADRFTTYDWVDNDGRNNMDKWIEAAAKSAGK
jgi:hypothetical protein